MDPDSLNEMYENLENEHEYAVQFVYDSPIVQDTLQNVGFRLRGNTSLSSAKNHLKWHLILMNREGNLKARKIKSYWQS